MRPAQGFIEAGNQSDEATVIRSTQQIIEIRSSELILLDRIYSIRLIGKIADSN